MNKVLDFLKYNKDYILSIGIKPTHADVNYGYIKKGDSINKSGEFFKVEQFKEKPDLITAKQYLESEEYFWNACLYTWPAQTFIDTVQRIAPNFWELGNKIYNSLDTNYKESVLRVFEKGKRFYRLCYLEKQQFGIYKATFFWSDVGNWKITASDKDNRNFYWQ